MPVDIETGETKVRSHDGGEFTVYVARPKNGSVPGLVLGHYICGVNDVMRRLAQRFAEAGFCVAVPDLFWRQEADVRLLNDPINPDPQEQRKALSLNAGFDDALGIEDLICVLGWLRAQPECGRKSGTLGWCLGGRMAYLMATRSDADCNVGYYGVNIEKYLPEADRIAAPLMLHIAGRDSLQTDDARHEIGRVLGSNPLVDLRRYPDADHAFAHLPGKNFRPEDAAAADDASVEFLRTHLK